MVKLRCFYDQWRGCLVIRVVRKTLYSKQLLKFPESMEWVDVKEGQQYPDRTCFELPYEWAMDGFFDEFEKEIKEAGITSKSQKEQLKKLEGLEAKLEAVSAHLKDMRRLVFKK